MRRVLVVGLPGSGKTTVAAAIGAATGWPCVDSGALLERTAGVSADRLLAQHGPERLREAESHVLTLLVSMPGPFVACVAAGAVRDPVDRERVRSGGHVVWVKRSLPRLVRRAGRGPAPGDETALQELAQECEPHFADVADHVLDMDRLSPATAAREVVEALPRD